MKKLLIVLLSVLMLSCTVGCGSSKSERIVIFSCQEEERIQAMKAAIAEKFPDLDIVIENVGTGNLAAKIKTEGTGIEADIIVDLEAAHMENLKDNFADLSSFDTSAFIDGVNPSHHKYVMWVKQYCGITVNAAYFREQGWEFPKTYEDLLDSKYQGLLAMPDPTTSGTGYAYYLNVVNMVGEEKALEYFRELAKNAKQFTSSGSGPISLLKQGEIVLAMGMVFQGVAEINAGADYAVIELETGDPYNQTGAAIISGRETKEHVAEVFQWFITEAHMIDCEQFCPGNILKNEQTKIPNYPQIAKDADMSGLDNINRKTELLGKWDLS
ncbi:MAG: extracellular solute-binding protein [Erysipelotrichaceae bacterium]|nr:extracellular solute-binding protein [Erysipelotrichaceae bacterium]